MLTDVKNKNKIYHENIIGELKSMNKKNFSDKLDDPVPKKEALPKM